MVRERLSLSHGPRVLAQHFGAIHQEAGVGWRLVFVARLHFQQSRDF
jgi:hypothetical protein